MPENKLLKQLELFDLIASKGLTATEYYLLCSMHDSTTMISGNTEMTLRMLIHKEWILEEVDQNKKVFTIVPKGYELINTVEKLFTIQKNKTAKQLMSNNYKENINKYKELFPNQKLPHGKAARSAYGNLEKNFRWFFENHEFKWDEIFKATAIYINDHQKKNWKFMRTSQYFIRKDNLSDLADMCENIKTGGYEEEQHRIKTKVV
tara:strand:- start:4583 stop:5200 length:618 start_codon:yes stop_codon:yes gene_type:complete